MKTFLLSILFLLTPKLCLSQLTANDDAVYLDSLFNIGNEKNYRYIQVIKDFKVPNKESYQMGVYYKSGKIQMKGAISTRDPIIKTGPFFYFYENGKRKSIINYENNKAVGTQYEFHENGEKKLEGVLVDKKENVIPNVQIKNAWNENGIQTIKEGNGFFEEGYYEGSLGFKNFERDFGSGKIVNNLKDSIWIGYNKKTKISFRENYKNGEFLEGVSIDSNKVEYKYTSLSDIRPVPKKGMNDFLQFVSKNLKIPDVKGLSGKIFISFVVDVDGKLTDFKVIRDIGYSIGQEAIRVLKSYGNWIPGELRGMKVRCTYSLPINILPMQ